MKDRFYTALIISCILILAVIAGCSSAEKVQQPLEDLESTCIQGTVRYIIPDESSPFIYPNVNIYAWSHEANQPLSETKSDKAGNYCIEVPIGDFNVDLRVIGLVYLEGESYKCRGSENNIEAGLVPAKCGDGCMKIEITAECIEYVPRRRNR